MSPGLEGTPVFHGHGESDLLVGLEAANDSRDAVTSKKSVTDYRLVTYPNLAHFVSPKEISDLLAFLKEVIPPRQQLQDKIEGSWQHVRERAEGCDRLGGIGWMAVGLAEKLEFVELLRRHREGKLHYLSA